MTQPVEESNRPEGGELFRKGASPPETQNFWIIYLPPSTKDSGNGVLEVSQSFDLTGPTNIRELATEINEYVGAHVYSYSFDDDVQTKIQKETIYKLDYRDCFADQKVLEGYKTLSGKEWNLKAPEQSSVADDDEVVVTPPPRPGPPVYLLRR